MKYEVLVKCPVHEKVIPIIVEAPTEEDAVKKILGSKVECLYYPPHSFKVEHSHIAGVRRPGPPVTAPVSVAPAKGLIVKTYSTTEIGEHVWTLTRKGEEAYREILRLYGAQATLPALLEEVSVETVECPVCGAEIPEPLYEAHVRLCRVMETGLRPTRIPPPRRRRPRSKYVWIVFKKPHGRHVKGEAAKLPESTAKRLIELGVAEPLKLKVA